MPFEPYIQQKKTYSARFKDTGNVLLEQQQTLKTKGGFLNFVLDQLSRTNNASANVALDLVNKGSFSPFKSAWEGFSGQKKTFYSDVLDEMGVQNKWVKGGLGFALDVALDPLTYLGVGAIAKGGKIAGKVLNKSGIALMEKAGTKWGAKTAEKMMTTMMKTPDGIAKYAQKASVNFMGKSIVSGEAISRFNKAVGITKVGEFVRDSKVGTWFGQAFIPKFRPSDIPQEQFAKLQNIADIYQTARRKGNLAIQSEIMEASAKLTKKERKMLSVALSKAKNSDEIVKHLPAQPGVALTGADEIARGKYKNSGEFRASFLSKPAQKAKTVVGEYQSPLTAYQAGDKAVYTNYKKIAKINRANAPKLMAEIEEVTGLTPTARPGFVKSEKSFTEKLKSFGKTGRPASEMHDVLGVRLVVQPNKVYQTLEQLQSRFNLNVRDYFKIPVDKSFGYRGINMKVTLPNGALAEIQVHTPESLLAANRIHPIYERWRGTPYEMMTTEQKAQYKLDRLTATRVASESSDTFFKNGNRPYLEAQKLTGESDERLAFSRALNDHDLVGVGKYLRSRLNEFWKEEHQRGLITTFREGYVPGLYKKTQGQFTRFSRPKIFNTPEEAAKAGYELINEGDILSLYAIRGVSSARQVAAKDFYERIKGFGQHLGGFGEAEVSAATIAGKTTVRTPFLSGYWFDKAIAREIEEFGAKFTDEATNSFLRGYDKVLGLWKGSVTALFPSFHARNAMSNMWLSWLAGVNPGMLSVRSAQALKVQKVARAMKTGNVEVVAKLGKEKIGKYTIAEIVNHANMTDVIAGGWMGREIAGTAVDQALDLVGMPGKMKKVFHPLKTGREVGSFVENNSRLMVFVDRLLAGDDAVDAAMHTKKYLFDYGDLTQFEQNVMRRVVPFYTWLRKNIPTQLEALVKQPAKFAAVGKAGSEIEKMSEDEAPEGKYLPDFIKSQFSIRIPNRGGSWKYIAPDLAFQDLASFTNLGDYISSISPLIKAPFELAANYDFFRKKQLADPSLPPDIFALEKAKKEALNNLRVAGVLNRLTDDQKGTLDKILRELIGVYVYSFDPATAKKYFKAKESKEESAIKKRNKKLKNKSFFEKLMQ